MSDALIVAAILVIVASAMRVGFLSGVARSRNERRPYVLAPHAPDTDRDRCAALLDVYMLSRKNGVGSFPFIAGEDIPADASFGVDHENLLRSWEGHETHGLSLVGFAQHAIRKGEIIDIALYQAERHE